MEFEVRPQKLNEVASTEEEIKERLYRISTELDHCKNRLQNDLDSSADISLYGSIVSVEDRIEETAEKLGVMAEKLYEIAKIYSQTEDYIIECQRQPAQISEPVTYDVDGNVKSSDTSIRKMLRILGINDDIDENINDGVSWFSKLMGKLNDKSVETTYGDIFSYGNDLWKMLQGLTSGNMDIGIVLDMAKDSAGVWESMYQYFDKNLVDMANKTQKQPVESVLGEKYGNTVGVVALLSSFMGFAKSYYNTMSGDYMSWQEMLGEWIGTGKEGVGVVESAYKLSNMKKGIASETVGKNANWFTLAETVMSTGGQAMKSYGKYNSDGNISVSEGAAIGVESSVSGLTTLISGVTFGLVNIDSDAASEELESWAKDQGNSIGETIVRNPSMREAYQNGNIFVKIGITGEAALKNIIDAKVKRIMNKYSKLQDVAISVAERIQNH